MARALDELGRSPYPRLVVETALLRLSAIEPLVEVDDLVQQVQRLASRLVTALVEQYAQRRMAGLLTRVEEQRATLEDSARKCLVDALSEADLETLGEDLGAV